MRLSYGSVGWTQSANVIYHDFKALQKVSGLQPTLDEKCNHMNTFRQNTRERTFLCAYDPV